MAKSISLTIIALLLLLVSACAPAPPGALTITLIADGETRTVTTEAQTVHDLLLQEGIALDEDDRVSPPENTFLTNRLTVRVVRVTVQTDTEERIIPYGRETVRDATLPAGETRLVSAGVNGLQVDTYAITLEDGVEVERRLIQRVTVRQPQNEVLLIGARQEVVATPISGTIAYLSAYNAWVMRNTSGNRHRLTVSGDLDGRVFDLSADGTRLLYTRASTESETLNTLWMVDTVTADAEAVQLDVENVLWAAWAPDGRTIAYSTGNVREAAPGWEALNNLYIARPRASDGALLERQQVLGPAAGGSYGWWGTVYSWSPDGQALAYARADEVGVIRLANRQTLTLLQFPPYRTYAAWAWTPTVAWSPDGLSLVTVVHGPSPTGELPEDSPVFDLYGVGVREENRRITVTLAAELASEVGMWSNPSFSPQGDVIVFGRARVPYTSQTSPYELYLMDRDGSDRRLLFPQDASEPGLSYPALAWDPAGGRIAVVYLGDLYLVTLDGAARRITDDGSITAVRWVASPQESQ